MNHLLTASLAYLFVQLGVPAAAATKAATPAAALIEKLVVLDCQLRIRQDDIDPPPKESKTWDERLDIEVQSPFPNMLIIEGKGMDFKPHVAYLDPLLKPAFKSVNQSDETRWQVRVIGGPDQPFDGEDIMTISRTTGRLEYNSTRLVLGRPMKTVNAIGTCTKKDMSKRMF